MLMPSLFGENLLDDFFDVPSFPRFVGNRGTRSNIMHTDVREKGEGYEIAMDLPGFKKEDIKAELKNGYLTINASMSTSKDEKDDDGKYIRKERYSGSCNRSFYVGAQITEDDIKARFKDGVLMLNVPKKEAKPEIKETKYISIEG